MSKYCPSCEELGHTNDALIERNNYNLDVGLASCSNLDCRVTEFYVEFDSQSDSFDADQGGDDA